MKTFCEGAQGAPREEKSSRGVLCFCKPSNRVIRYLDRGSSAVKKTRKSVISEYHLTFFEVILTQTMCRDYVFRVSTSIVSLWARSKPSTGWRIVPEIAFKPRSSGNRWQNGRVIDFLTDHCLYRLLSAICPSDILNTAAILISDTLVNLNWLRDPTAVAGNW